MFRRNACQFTYRFENCNGAANWTNMKSIDNKRHQFKLDGSTGKATMTTGDESNYNGTMPGSRTAGACSKTLWLGWTIQGYITIRT